jgi:hypothetical protein
MATQSAGGDTARARQLGQRLGGHVLELGGDGVARAASSRRALASR